MIFHRPQGLMNKTESFHVYSRIPTDEELKHIASDLVRSAEDIYSEDPGVWSTFREYLSFQLGKETFRFAGFKHDRQFIEKFVQLCFSHISVT